MGEGVRLPLPAFRVAVSVTEQAQELLDRLGDTIVVSAYIDGNGVALPDNTCTPFRNVYFGDFTRELRSSGTVRFSDLTVSSRDLERFDNEDIYVCVGVRSGRRSSEGNLLYSKKLLLRRSRLQVGEEPTFEVDAMLIKEWPKK